MKHKMKISNDGKSPKSLYVEPEGADFWILPGQTFELRADVEDGNAHFEILYNDKALQIYPSNRMGHISVFSDDKQLECAFQRPKTE